MSTRYNARIVSDKLMLHLDAANPKSYPGSGTTWKDLSDRGHDMTLVNGPTFNSGFGGYLKFDGSNDSATVEIDNLAGSSIFECFSLPLLPLPCSWTLFLTLPMVLSLPFGLD